MRLFTSDQMREIDSHAINQIGIPSLVLMENAGIKTLFTLEKILDGLKGKRFTIVCGKGNNGGDGLVIARHLQNNNIPVYVFLTAEPESISEDAAVNYSILCKSGLQPTVIKGEEDINRLRIAMEFSEAIIDSVFGTGFKGQIKGMLARIINAMNDSRAIKIAIDAPSGLNGNTGEISAISFVADYSITLGAPKVGLFMFPGKKITGEVWIAEIGIPDCSFNSVETDSFLVTSQLVQTLIPPKDDQLHKGSAGKLFILAGSDQYQGAGVVASYGAHRSGAGIVNLGFPDCLKGNICSQVLPETILSFIASSKGVFDLKADFVENLNGRYRALLAGPGWGRSSVAEKSLETLLENWQGSLVLDADALNQLKNKELLKNREFVPVITPHLGEMARLIDSPLEDVATSQIQVARDFAKTYKTIVVLKSAVTVISDHNGRVFVSSRPNPGLAKGGSGDLLSGLITGLIASGLSELNAAITAVHIQAEAAEEAVLELGVDSVTISEIAAYVPRAFKKLREGEA